MDKEPIVISLGGSLINSEKPDISFLKRFIGLILMLSKNYRFFIVCGGGRISREYISAGKKAMLKNHDLDLLGILGTKMNALLVKFLFGKKAVFAETFDFFKFKEYEETSKIVVASGYFPGHSSDKIAVDIAVIVNAGRIINMSNIDYVYDNNKNNLSQIKWNDFLEIIGKKWHPGKNVPFDPVASRTAKRNKKEVIIINGKKLKNFEKAIVGKKFNGTLIY